MSVTSAPEGESRAPPRLVQPSDTMSRDFIERDASGHSSVEGFHACTDRNRGQDVTSLTDQPGEAIPLTADYQHYGSGDGGHFGDPQGGPAVQPHQGQARPGISTQAAIEVSGARNPNVGRRPRRGLPGGSGHARRAAFWNKHAVCAESGGRPDDRPEIAWIGD